jgi:hypothetical protein
MLSIYHVSPIGDIAGTSSIGDMVGSSSIGDIAGMSSIGDMVIGVVDRRHGRVVVDR